jgi:hypothetical protein
MNVHLVGSIGLDRVEEIFRTVGTLLVKRRLEIHAVASD